MMTSYKETQLIEHHILNQLNVEDRLVFDARLLIDRTLRENVFFQKQVYQLVKLFNRRKVKRQVERIHEKIFSDLTKVEFQQTVLKFFNP